MNEQSSNFKFELIESPSILIKDKRALVIFPETQAFLGFSKSIASAFANRRSVPYSEIASVLIKNFNLSTESAIERTLLKIENAFSNAGVLKTTKKSLYPPQNGQEKIIDHAVMNLSITERCNLRCSHCYSDAGISASRKDEMNTKEITKIIDNFCKIGINRSTVDLAITGGEPLLRKDIIEIVQYVAKFQQKEKISKIMLNSNGILVDDSIANALANAKVHVAVSLDGSNPLTHEIIRGKGTFLPTIKGIKLLIDAGVWVGINMFVHNRNANDIENTLELAQKLGVKAFTCFNLLRVGRANPSNINNLLPERITDSSLYRIQHDILIRKPKKINLMKNSLFLNQLRRIRNRIPTRCGIGRHPTFYIRSNGDVYPCLAIYSKDYQIGNVKDTDLSQLWKFNRIYEKLANRNPITDERCGKCVLRKFCGNGCPGENIQLTGQLMTPVNICKELKDGILELMWILAENPPYLSKKQLGPPPKQIIL